MLTPFGHAASHGDGKHIPLACSGLFAHQTPGFQASASLAGLSDTAIEGFLSSALVYVFHLLVINDVLAPKAELKRRREE